MPIRLAGTYRCVVRDSHFHNSYSYGFGQDNYGIVLACGAADNLVENNVARFMNKPILFNNSGGGNVIGYNYADNSWSCDGNNDDGFQEVNIDCHCAFPHMELMEGNWAPHMGATITHGNAGYLTTSETTHRANGHRPLRISRRRRLSGVNHLRPSMPTLLHWTFQPRSQDDRHRQCSRKHCHHQPRLPADLGTTSTGKGSPPATSQVYISANGSGPAIFLVDQTTVAWSSIWLTGNFDTVNKKVMWNASALTASLSASTQSLPASLYYVAKPAWWPTGNPWPWVGSDLSPRWARFLRERARPHSTITMAGDASCILNCGNSCCGVGPACSL